MQHPTPLTLLASAKCVMKFNFALLLAAGIFLGQTAQAQTVVFSENFEGAFNSWTVGDLNTDGIPAYWSDVDVSFGTPFPRGGSWMGYCAGVGFAGTASVPFYQDDMFAYMERTANLTSATSASLSFWYNAPSLEDGIDLIAVYVDGTAVFSHSSTTFGWQQATINLNSYVGGNRVIRFVFFSDDSITAEGYYLDDIVLTATLPQQANLTPYQRNGWSDKIVVTRVTGTSTDDANLQAGETLYVDWAVINNGSGASPGSSTQLYINDVLRNTWSGGSLQPNSFSFVNDYNIGSLPAGTNTLRLRADSGNTVSESNEIDNEYTKTIVIGGTPDIRISPLTLAFNVTNNGDSGFAAAMEAPATEEAAIAFSPEQKLQLAHEVTQRFEAGEERVDVIVNFVPPAGKPRRVAEWNSKPRLQQWHRNVKQRQDEVLDGLAADDLRVVHRLQNQSTVTGMVTRKGFDQLARHPRVASIEIVREVKPHLAQGIPLMNASLYRATYNGSGVAVAIVDSGVDYTHPRLGGGGFPNAKVIGGYDFGDNDPNPQAAGNAHGTACAGIAAGDLGTTGDYIGGVAPNAKIYALKITAGSGGSANDAAIIAAWDWCITHRNDDPANPILVISTSFGGQRHFNACDGVLSSYATAANNAVAAGLTLFVSSGNEGFCDSLSSPACLSGVISVGAVYDSGYGTTTFCIESVSCVPRNQDFNCSTGWSTDDVTAADKVTRYSNTASFLSLLAPAHRAHTTDIVGAGGYNTAGDYATGFGGTSAACPYAAGAAAALQSAARLTQGRFLTPSEVRARLASTGDLITDAKSGITTPRVNLGRAIESLGQNSALTIFNDGNAHLNVTSIVAETSAPWITWSPPAPFTIAPGAAQVVAVSIDPAQAPVGPSTRRLLVHSDDAGETPYPGGVFINVTNIANQPTITATRSGSRVIISWTTNSAGFILQSSTNIAGSAWGTVSPNPTTIGNLKYVTNNITDPRRFYRLRR